MDLVIRGGSVVVPDRQPATMDIGVSNGAISGLFAPGQAPSAERVIDATGKHVFAGVVDPHLHVGLGNGDEDWFTETRSAAAGGVTSIFTFLMAGTSYQPLITDAQAVAASRAIVDYGLHLVPCAPVHLDELDAYVAAGITSYKYFTSFRGEEGAYLGITGSDDGYLFAYLRAVATVPGGMACVHPENIEVVWRLRDELRQAGRDGLPAWDESRPDYVEAECCYRAMFYARQTGCPLYLVHVSSALALDEIRSWRRRHPDQPIFVETCPHFLTHHKEMPIGSLGKINPPLRSEADVEAVWQAVFDGTVDTIGSDHVPRRRDKKAGSIWTASAGFPGTAAILPILLSEGHHKRGLPLARIAAITSANPARIMGADAKGSITIGADADLTIVDLALEQPGSPDRFQSYADYSLYDGWPIRGWPVMTIRRGAVIMENGTVVGEPGSGRYLAR